MNVASKMEIDPQQIKIEDLVAGYKDSGDEGVVAWGGKLDVRPPYQREFVYDREDAEAVIHSILKGYPLNILYWVDREKEVDGKRYEVLDGQQRILSICQFYNEEYSIDGGETIFGNLKKNQKEDFLQYELTVYFCKGPESEKLEWFKIVNMSGKELNPQELRNAVYTGEWLADAKRKFSKTGGWAYELGKNYVNGIAKKQDYLQTAIEWIAGEGDKNIRIYMSKHQSKSHATALSKHFESVISWVRSTFTGYRKEMKGLDWGRLYEEHKDRDLDPNKLEGRIKNLLKNENDELKSTKGIWEYVLTDDKRLLDIRTFNNTERRALYERQNGECLGCKEEFKIEEMDADHIEPWSEGGATRMENARMLCKSCNRGRRH